MTRHLFAWIGAAIAMLALLEVGVFAAVEAGLLHTPAPRYGAGDFWRGDHPVFGVWHQPNARARHQSPCFDVVYTTNSVGARDVERRMRTDAPRVVVLGDSFLEGWGVRDADRFSNRLEVLTGVEHLNFAMAHFGPYHELLVYRELASRFDHHAVVIGVTPENDFANVDLQRALRNRSYDYRYGPYLVGDPPALRHVDWRENPLRRRLRQVSWAFNAALAAWEALRPLPPALPSSLPPVEGAPFSHFYDDLDEHSVALVEEILGRLADAAAGRPVVVVLVPTLEDVARYLHSGPAPLSQRLERFGASRGLRVVDLLPVFAADPRPRRLFHACDYHWSWRAHDRAARYLVETLGPDFWRTPRHARARE